MSFALCESIHDWNASKETLRTRPYGVIETSAGRLVAVHLRPWPKLLAWPDFWPVGGAYHAGGRADRCLLYYNQPRRHPNFLALKYVVTTRGTPFATFRAALTSLDGIAQLKQSDAILCDAFNSRLSDRFLHRQGWEKHRPLRRHRNFIKRFYGQFSETRLPLPESASTVGTS